MGVPYQVSGREKKRHGPHLFSYFIRSPFFSLSVQLSSDSHIHSHIPFVSIPTSRIPLSLTSFLLPSFSLHHPFFLPSSTFFLISSFFFLCSSSVLPRDALMTSIKSSVSPVSRKTQSGSPSASSTNSFEEATEATVTVMVMVMVAKGVKAAKGTNMDGEEGKGRRKMCTHPRISVGIC